jgi:putative transposase
MPRRLRDQTPGRIYHITARGTRRSDIVLDDDDRIAFLTALDHATRRASWELLGYTLMSNHYHLLLRLTQPSLSLGMHALNTIHAVYFNSTHEYSGHLYQARYHAQGVESDPHLLEAVRYIALNPVRAGIVRDPAHWPWSSHAAMVGATPAPRMLSKRATLEWFDGDPRRYRDWVADGIGKPRRPPLDVVLRAGGLAEAVAAAHRIWGYQQLEIARFVGLSPSTVSRMLRRAG